MGLRPKVIESPPPIKESDTASIVEESVGSHFPRATFLALTGLVGFGTLVRLVLLLVYPPLRQPDTSTYLSLAQQIASLDLSSYDGGRTPMYPLLLLLGGQDARVVYFMQTLLGIAASVLLFLTALELKRSITLAIFVGLVPTVLLNQLFMEANLLTEHLAGVLAVGSLYVGVRILKRGAGRASWRCLGCLSPQLPSHALATWHWSRSMPS